MAAMLLWPPLPPLYVQLASIILYLFTSPPIAPLFLSFYYTSPSIQRTICLQHCTHSTTALHGMRVMKDRPAFSLRGISAVHNLIMTAVSLILTIGIGYHVVATFKVFGAKATYCGVNDEHDTKLGFWVNWFYLSKFYEYVDTIILALRKKELNRLHVIHHSLTGLVSWIAMDAEIIMGWITAFNNSLIHVFMYWYYYKQTLGINVWWKKFLTTGQILQFVIDTTTSYPYLYFWYIGSYCRGTITAWIIANIAGTLLLLLFVEFYISTYSKPKKDKST